MSSKSEKPPQGKKANKPPQKQQQNNAPNKGGGKPAKAPKAVDNNDDVKRDQKLQAVVFTDNFLSNVISVDSSTPSVLLPVVNIPVMDYTFEFLSQGGIEEIILFCINSPEVIQNYIEQSRWPSLLSVRVVTSILCKTEGDALRELDALNIVRSDPFVLISGDVVSNISLKNILTFHAKKRSEDPNNVMTVTLKKMSKHAPIKPLQDDLVVSFDKRTNQLLLFDNHIENDHISVPVEILEEHEDILYAADLFDCHIDVCSPDFLLQFSDNFDYQNVRDDFIHNEVSNWSLGKHIYGYVAEKEYATRLTDPRSYHALSRDITTRWCYPITSDNSHIIRGDHNTEHDLTYQLPSYAYRSTSATISRQAYVSEGSVLGDRVMICDGAEVVHTVIGDGSGVGKEAKIINSYLFSGVTVAEKASITSSILCEHVTIGAGVIINRGCIIERNVTVPTGTVIGEYMRVTIGGGGQDGSSGSGSVTYKLISLLESSINSTVDASADVLRSQCMGCVSSEIKRRSLRNIMSTPSDDEDDDEDDEDGDYKGGMSTTSGGKGIKGGGGNMDLFSGGDNNTNSTGGGMGMNSSGSRKDLGFISIIRDMVLTGKSEEHPADSVLMEIKGCKFAQNKTYSDCIEGVAPALLTIALNSCTGGAVGATLKVSDYLTAWKSLVKNKAGWGYKLLKPITLEKEDQLKLISCLEDFALLDAHSSVFMGIFRYILQIIYEEELLTEDGVLYWIDIRSQQQLNHPEEVALRLFSTPQVQQFVEWIQEEDDEDDDDEEDDSEEGDESEEGSGDD